MIYLTKNQNFLFSTFTVDHMSSIFQETGTLGITLSGTVQGEESVYCPAVHLSFEQMLKLSINLLIFPMVNTFS